MSGMQDLDLAPMAEARQPAVPHVEKKDEVVFSSAVDSRSEKSDSKMYTTEPTAEEMNTLRRVSGPLNWQMFTVTFVEFCERFSYYGTTAVFVNFIQQPRPFGSRLGNIQETMQCFDAVGETVCMQPGGLGQGQQASTGLTTFNQFWAYVMPLLGGYIADTYLRRYATIQWSIVSAIIGHIILIVVALPDVMDNPNNALGAFAVGLIFMGIGTGGFKSNISPLLAEQIKQDHAEIIKTKSGERVIQDPAITVSRCFLYFYMMINLGSLGGGISMVYVARYLGYAVAYATPTAMFFLCPVVLLLCKKHYVLQPPTGSVTSKAFKLLRLASKGRFSLNHVATYRSMTSNDFWEAVKPSHLGTSAPAWMAAIDDNWVDQVARGFNACKVFTFLSLYWLAYLQMLGNLTSMSAVLELNGVPNDLVNNLNPITLVIFILIMDSFIYPAIRRTGLRFTPIKRSTVGFFIASLSMVSSAVLQSYIYRTSACPAAHVSDLEYEGLSCTAPISVWVQTVPYCLIAFSEIFTSITGLDYAISKAPENMRGLVMGVNLLQIGFAAALSQAFTALSTDPLLVWNYGACYGVVAVLAFIGGIGFWFTWKDLDAREDELNSIGKIKYTGRGPRPGDEE